MTQCVDIEQKFDKKAPVCSVTVTCHEADERGDMQVEMSCEGDIHVASYIIARAQLIIEAQL